MENDQFELFKKRNPVNLYIQPYALEGVGSVSCVPGVTDITDITGMTGVDGVD
jgi:hypothetical protein